jgi:transcriptional regulator with XRE-family HTH domain
MVKQELARALNAALLERDWNQSDLARKSGLPRELISAYCTRKSMPTPLSLNKIVKALGFKTVEEFLPEISAVVADDENPALDIRQIAGQPDKVWLRINQMVSFSTVTQIVAILNADKIAAEPPHKPVKK